MERADLPVLRALGFTDDELKELDLWEPATGDPAYLAEAYIRRSKKKDTLTALRGHLRDLCRRAREDRVRIRHVWFEQRSASKAHVRREEFDSACDAVLRGLSKTLYVWRTDRLSRRGMGAVDRLIDDFERKQRARIVSASEGLDSSQPGMRIVFGILADRAREEARDITKRIQSHTDNSKLEGKWHGGVAPYGLHSPKGSGKLQRLPEEYPTARRIAEYLLDHKVPEWIADTLNREQKRTRKGKMWRAQTILNLAHSPSWAGLVPNRERVHDSDGNPLDKWVRRSEPLLDAKGRPISCGEGVVTYAEWLKIQSILHGRTGKAAPTPHLMKARQNGFGTRKGTRQPKTVMGWILHCPFCDGPMSNGGYNYRCDARVSMGESACQGTSTARKRVDEAVAILWVNHILSLSPESDTIHEIARRWLNYQDPAKEQRKREVTALYDAAIERQAKLRKEYFVLGGMDEAEFESLRREQAVIVSELKTDYDALTQENDLTPLMDPESLAAIWNAEGIEGRRALWKAAAKKITLKPPVKSGDRTPILDRLVVEWRDGKDAAALAGTDKAMDLVERTRQHTKAAEAA
ncbi:recombinase family protein [Streptomyces rubradiris]|uniref:recombinase family protein n=1 Tax=Streptomyces rubradiris TaxID=285531 RepID=UPI0036E327DD